MHTLTYLFAACIMFILGCADKKNKVAKQVESETSFSLVKVDPDSTDFYKKFRKIYPYFSLQIDTAAGYTSVYTKYRFADTTDCSSFKLNRVFIGEIEYVLAEVKLCDREHNRYHLQTGSLKLWLCTLPSGIKTNDKILITAYVYDIMGFEKTFGYPTIISSLYYK